MITKQKLMQELFQRSKLHSFSLKQGYGMIDFIRINGDIDPWLQKQPGFISRHITTDPDGRISDILFWDNAGSATASMSRLMQEFSDAPIHDVIDQQTVSWSVRPVYHELKK